jgi:hypothetical protein
MKFTVALIVTALLSFIGCMYFPWWTIAVAAFITALLDTPEIMESFFGWIYRLIIIVGRSRFLDRC